MRVIQQTSIALKAKTVPSTGNQARIADLPQGCYLSLVTTLAGLAGLEEGWRALETSGTRPVSVFQSFAWVSTWADTYLTGSSGAEPLIIAGFQQDKLVFVWPLMKENCHGLSTLTWLSAPFAQYGDVLCEDSQSVAMWLGASVKLFRRLKNIDLVWLRHVRADAVINPWASKNLSDGHSPEQAPCLDLSAYASEEDYEARYSSTQRKRRKKIRKSLEASGPVSFARVPAGTVGDLEIGRAIDEKNKWLEERGRQNRILGCPSHVAFLSRLLRLQDPSMETVLTTLSVGHKSISWELGFRFNGTHYAYLTSHVNELTDLSPGRLHMDLSQRLCLADGQKVFDLMVPNDQHKASWSSTTVNCDDYFLPLSAGGHLFGSLYLRLLRPLLRRGYYAMSPRLLRLLKPITRH